MIAIFLEMVNGVMAFRSYGSSKTPSRYHDWMQSEELLEKTASQRLTLEQEYEMQQKWCHDSDKCTFIVLSKELWIQSESEKDSMIGDVNLFLNKENDRPETEVEVMIAEPGARGKGHGSEAVLIMLYYGFFALGLRTFVAKIGSSNSHSIAMFEKLGFHKVSENKVFNEVTYTIELTDELQMALMGKLGHVQQVPYPLQLRE